MANRFANGAKAFGFCDVCGFRFDLKKLKNLVVKTKQTQIKACPQCWTPDQPQLQLGMYPISDPQAIRDPRPDTNTWYQSGTNGLQTSPTSGLLPANPFTADGTTTVLVNAPNHGALTGTYVTFSGATVFSGVVIVGQYQLTVVNANSYAITYATPVPAGNGGGSAVTFAYQPAAGVLQQGFPGEGMLVIQWGWNPIGGARDFDAVLTPNTLVGAGEVGQVTFAPWTSVFFTTPGTYSWTAPVGVTQVYVLCVGGGGSGGPSGGTGVSGTNSSFDTFFAGGGVRGATGSGGAGGQGTTLSATVFGGNGGAGGSGFYSGGGGGAGGYAGNGGNGRSFPFNGNPGSGGGGGGSNGGLSASAGGGGVGLSGQGTSGAGGSLALNSYGFGGSDGQNGDANGNGGLYGGGGGGRGVVFSGGGGGGGGGLRWTFLTVVPGTTYPVVVGAGGVVAGAGAGGNGAVRINYLPVP